MNFTFLLAGLGFVAVAGVLYYFTAKTDDVEEISPRKEKKEVVQPVVHEVCYFSFFCLIFFTNFNKNFI